MFFCTDGPLRIRNNPNLTSAQIGSLNTFEMVPILEKDNSIITIDDLTDYWYKIKKDNIEGYVFGGYGIIIQNEYNIHSIDDIVKLLPDKIKVNVERRWLFTYGQFPMVCLSYELVYLDNIFHLSIYYRPSIAIDINEIARIMNLEIGNYNSTFGMGSSYTLLNNSELSEEITTINGDKGKYLFLDWGSDYTYDIAAFLFERKFNDDFNGLIISFTNLWTNQKDKRVIEIDNKYIRDAKSDSIKESILYQLFYEIVKRYRLVLEN
jgi:hypothetical protein